jgi:hypothetical protein
MAAQAMAIASSKAQTVRHRPAGRPAIVRNPLHGHGAQVFMDCRPPA